MKLTLTSDQAKTTDIKATLHTLSKRERTLYAWKKFGVFFGLAILSVFVPVAHFVLVPTFLILSIVVGIKSYKIQARLEILENVQCLQCQEILPKQFLLGEEERIKCGHCFAQYAIEGTN